MTTAAAPAQAAAFRALPKQAWDFYGSIHHLQRLGPCSEQIWSGAQSMGALDALVAIDRCIKEKWETCPTH